MSSPLHPVGFSIMNGKAKIIEKRRVDTKNNTFSVLFIERFLSDQTNFIYKIIKYKNWNFIITFLDLL